jgi:hypothetical protein
MFLKHRPQYAYHFYLKDVSGKYLGKIVVEVLYLQAVVCKAGVIPQSLQHEVQVTLASLGGCDKS